VIRARSIRYAQPRLVEIVEVDVPEPGPGQVQVEALACGICAWDLHLYERGAASEPPSGHEGVGRVTRVGAGVTGIGVPGDLWHLRGLTVVNSSPSSALRDTWPAAIRLLQRGQFDLQPLVSHVVELEAYRAARARHEATRRLHEGRRQARRVNQRESADCARRGRTQPGRGKWHVYPFG
jgi:threonine dehydrogenase-like Zn-dependent dehydrogenase